MHVPWKETNESFSGMNIFPLNTLKFIVWVLFLPKSLCSSKSGLKKKMQLLAWSKHTSLNAYCFDCNNAHFSKQTALLHCISILSDNRKRDSNSANMSCILGLFKLLHARPRMYKASFIVSLGRVWYLTCFV